LYCEKASHNTRLNRTKDQAILQKKKCEHVPLSP
jgi:hypothetical protein